MNTNRYFAKRINGERFHIYSFMKYRAKPHAAKLTLNYFINTGSSGGVFKYKFRKYLIQIILTDFRLLSENFIHIPLIDVCVPSIVMS